MSPMLGPRWCCCGPHEILIPPTGVSGTACTFGNCVLSSTDGTGINLESTLSGGVASAAPDPVWGRPGPGLLIESAQDLDGFGCYSLLKFDNPFPSHYNCGIYTICGEFLNLLEGNSVKVWPALIQGDNIYVQGSAASATVTSTAAWTAVQETFYPSSAGGPPYGVLISGYSAGGVSTFPSPPQFYVETYPGFVIQINGTAANPSHAALDNVCASSRLGCPSGLCHVAYMDLSGFTTGGGTVGGGVHTLANGLLNDLWMVPYLRYLNQIAYWGNGDSPVIIYSVGGNQRVKLLIQISIPLRPNGTLDTSGTSILGIRLQYQHTATSLIFTLGQWYYHLPMTSFGCGAPLQYTFYQSLATGFTETHPPVIAVTFEET